MFAMRSQSAFTNNINSKELLIAQVNIFSNRRGIVVRGVPSTTIDGQDSVPPQRWALSSAAGGNMSPTISKDVQFSLLQPGASKQILAGAWSKISLEPKQADQLIHNNELQGFELCGRSSNCSLKTTKGGL